MAADKQIYVPITLGVDSYKKELATAATATQQSGAQIATAAQKASEANLSAAKATKTLQQEYRTAAKEAQKLAQIHGLNNAATLEAASKAAQYKDQLDDVNDRINAFHPEKRFQLAAQGMSAALSVVQAGVGIFSALGISSQSAEKAITAMMAIQGLATALQNVEAMKGAYQAISVMVKTQVIPSLVTMNGIIMASGIIALVAVVAALAYNWYQTSKAQEEAAKSLKEYSAALQKTAQAEQDLYVETLKGRAKEQARLNNDATKKITGYYQQIKSIEEKASEESRSLTKAEQLEITSLRKQAVLVNEGLLVAQREQNKKFAEEDYKVYKEAQDKKAKAAKEFADKENAYRMRANTLNRQMSDNAVLYAEQQAKATEDASLAAAEAMSNSMNVPTFQLPNIDEVIKKANYAERLKQFGDETRALVQQHIGGAFAGAGEAIGNALATGDDVLKAVGAAIGKSLAQLAVSYGASLIALSVPMMAVGNPLGFVYAGAGVALIAAGSFVSAKMGSGGASSGGSAGGGSMSGGTSSGWSGTGGFNTGFGSMQAMAITGGAKISGRDLQLVYGREGYFSRRVTGK